ncbi:lipoate--protein ligase family protein [Globicatella sanguinis]
MSEFLSHHHWLYTEVGSGSNADDGLVALSWQDAFIRHIMTLNDHPSDKSSQAKGIIHFYRLNYPTIILGPKDTRLKALPEGIAHLNWAGFATHLRAHGGLAVVSDPGIINISFISNLKEYPLTIDEGYEQMIRWLKEALSPMGLKVESYEVPDSYCPGTYDIVIQQQKIGGIAQRRFKDGVAVAAYISVIGNQKERSEIIRQFYQTSEADSQYPNVNPDVMANINDFLAQSISVEKFKQLLLNTVQQQTKLTHLPNPDQGLEALYQKMYQKTLDRNYHLPINK